MLLEKTEIIKMRERKKYTYYLVYVVHHKIHELLNPMVLIKENWTGPT
jgi:hypothetical protein